MPRLPMYINLYNAHQDYTAGERPRPSVSHCLVDMHIHYEPTGPDANGHEYIDFGLPSGTLWATMNIGATAEDEAGLYFAWGETTGYTLEQALSNTRLFDSASWNTTHSLDKYLDGTELVLLLDDDAANATWGGDWHMPTKEQVQELINNTTLTVDSTHTEFTLTSNINGASMTIYSFGTIWGNRDNANRLVNGSEQYVSDTFSVELEENGETTTMYFAQHIYYSYNSYNSTVYSGVTSGFPYGDDGYAGRQVRGVLG